MENLKRILDIIKNNTEDDLLYYIPECWNSIGYEAKDDRVKRDREIQINPKDFTVQCIEAILKESKVKNELFALGSRENSEPLDIRKSVIYSMLPRMFTAWKHNDEGFFEGTFLKALWLLPYLKMIGVNTIYLLPVFEYSNKYKKGEIGSPYSIKNIYSLDRNLHDKLLGEYSKELLDTQFKAFVEACHALGIYVMVDFVFRTVARDNDLIIEHPDWFYWIKSKSSESFKTPAIDSIKKPTVVSDKVISNIYKAKGLGDYLNQFTCSPDVLDPQKWNGVLDTQRETGENILEIIEREFEITTTPGFSDVINDTQPPWTDVTYLKFYFDLHKKAKACVKDDQAPYVLQDIAKLNLYRGDKVNSGLWDYTVNVIPYYQKEFGIDGARIDMGHALPPELNREIIQKAGDSNKNFILWSEEFNPANSPKAKEDGFDFMTGGLWANYKGVEDSGFYKALISDLMMASMPLTGALETADTPRAALRYKEGIGMMVFLNYFIPNAIPLINSGMEVMEIQPMNLGLDNTEEGQFVLDEKDTMYGKLAFFDNYILHWTNSENQVMTDILKKAHQLREKYFDLIDKKYFIYQKELNRYKNIIFLCYFNKDTQKGVFFLANRSKDKSVGITLDKLLPEDITNNITSKIIFSKGDFCSLNLELKGRISLKPKEFIVIDNG